MAGVENTICNSGIVLENMAYIYRQIAFLTFPKILTRISSLTRPVTSIACSPYRTGSALGEAKQNMYSL